MMHLESGCSMGVLHSWCPKLWFPLGFHSVESTLMAWQLGLLKTERPAAPSLLGLLSEGPQGLRCLREVEEARDAS
jgi:hypothetical protein